SEQPGVSDTSSFFTAHSCAQPCAGPQETLSFQSPSWFQSASTFRYAPTVSAGQTVARKRSEPDAHAARSIGPITPASASPRHSSWPNDMPESPVSKQSTSRTSQALVALPELVLAASSPSPASAWEGCGPQPSQNGTPTSKPTMWATC